MAGSLGRPRGPAGERGDEARPHATIIDRRLERLYLQRRAPAAVSGLARSRRSQTSSSVTWEKSSYQRPTAWNGSGVCAQTQAPASPRISSQVEAAEVGTATTTSAG